MADSKTRIIRPDFRDSSDSPQRYERFSLSSAGNHKDLLNVKFVGSGRDVGLSLGSLFSESRYSDSWVGSWLEESGGPPRLKRPRVGRRPNPGEKRLPSTSQPTTPGVGVAGLLLVPIPTPYDELTSLVNRKHRDIALASGEQIAWRMIDDPRLHDDIYQRQRAPELEKADDASATAFHEAAARAGTKERYIAREYWEAILHFGLQPHELPAIMIVAKDPVNALARLHLDRRMFEDEPREGILADILIRELSQQTLLGYAIGGAFTRSSMQAIQNHLNSLVVRLQQLASSPHERSSEQVAQHVSRQPADEQGAPTGTAHAYAHSADHGSVSLSRIDYERLVLDRGQYDIIIDGMENHCYKREPGTAQHKDAKLNTAEFKMLRGYVATRARRRPSTFYEGASDAPEAATRIFQSARKKADIRQPDDSWLLFRAHRELRGEPWSHEFAPPDNVRWLLIEPPVE